jgi:hypothetical protein
LRPCRPDASPARKLIPDFIIPRLQIILALRPEALRPEYAHTKASWTSMPGPGHGHLIHAASEREERRFLTHEGRRLPTCAWTWTWAFRKCGFSRLQNRGFRHPQKHRSYFLVAGFFLLVLGQTQEGLLSSILFSRSSLLFASRLIFIERREALSAQ